jgi:hypothetical protein
MMMMMMNPYSSRLRITMAGKTVKRTDPRLPDSLREVIDDTAPPGPGVGGVDTTESSQRTEPEQFRRLLKAITPLLRDISATGAILPDIEDSSWDDDPDVISALIGKSGISYQGIRIRLSLSDVERLADLAQQVQEWEVEALWHTGRNSSWPECPIHPNRHPLSADMRDGYPSWYCPVTGAAISEIGALENS